MDNACNCDCISCAHYYSCESELKLEESTRDYWLEQREYDEQEETNRTVRQSPQKGR